MKIEDTKKANINTLIALCHIIDDFDEFNKNLAKLITTKHNQDFIFNLEKISKGKKVFGAKNLKKFYKQNKNTIDKINKYSSISSFICHNYNHLGKYYNYSSLPFFYQYFIKHQQNLPNIILLLEKIKDLGFTKLSFNENINFTNDEYYINTEFRRNFDITYLDNLLIIPNYKQNEVKYKTTKSNYKIILSPQYPRISYNNDKEIILNSLLFDFHNLPESISSTTIFDHIINLKKEQEENCIFLRNSIDLNISIENLYKKFIYIKNIVPNLNNEDIQQRLLEILSQIQGYISKLDTIRNQYDDIIIQDNPSITEDRLQKEKQLCLKSPF